MNLKFERVKNDIVIQAKIIYIISASIMCLLGIAMIIFRQALAEEKLLSYLVGAVFCIVGISKIFGYFANDLYRLAFQYDMALGIFDLIIGIILLIFPNLAPVVTEKIPLPSNAISYAIPHLLCFWIILDSVFKFQTAWDGKRFGIHKWVIMLVCSILLLIYGVFAETFVLTSSDSILIILGVGVLFDGLENWWHTAYTVRVRVRKKDREDKYLEMLSKGGKGNKGGNKRKLYNTLKP